MNPKMTEFLANDRIADFRSDAARHQSRVGSERTSLETPVVLATKRTTVLALAWHRVRHAITV